MSEELAIHRALRARLQEPTQAPQGTADAGQAQDFVSAVHALVQAGVPYGTACQRVSLESPELYEKHREESMLNG
jgi:hypothetical protein